MKAQEYKAYGERSYYCSCPSCTAYIKSNKKSYRKLARHRIKQSDAKTINNFLWKGEY